MIAVQCRWWHLHRDYYLLCMSLLLSDLFTNRFIVRTEQSWDLFLQTCPTVRGSYIGSLSMLYQFKFRKN